MKPASTTADSTVSFAEMKPLPAAPMPVADGRPKAGPDITVSLAETPARVHVPSARSLPAVGNRPGTGPQSKTLFGMSPTAAASQAREPAPPARDAAPQAQLAPKPRPRAAVQSKTLFGMSPVASPQAREALAGAPAAPTASAVGEQAQPALAPRGSSAGPTESKAASAPEASKREHEGEPPQGVFSVNTPTDAPAVPSALSTSAEFADAARVLPSERENDRTQDVSLTDISLVEARINAPKVPTSAGALGSAAEQGEQASARLLDAAHDALPQVAQHRNTTSTDPAPKPRSALKYGMWAAIPVGLCAAWLAMRSPSIDEPGANVAQPALRSEQQTDPVRATPPASAPTPTEAPAAAIVPPEPAPSEPAAAAPEGNAPAPEQPSAAAQEPTADPVATAEAAAAAESDPDAEDADVEIDASRKVVAARADKLVNEGHALRRKNKLVPARAKYRDALALYPGFPRALAGLVQVSIQQRDGKAAVNLAKQLVKLRPGQISYLVLLGDAYKVAGKAALAKETWKDAARKGSATAKARLGN